MTKTYQEPLARRTPQVTKHVNHLVGVEPELIRQARRTRSECQLVHYPGALLFVQMRELLCECRIERHEPIVAPSTWAWNLLSVSPTVSLGTRLRDRVRLRPVRSLRPRPGRGSELQRRLASALLVFAVP